MHPPVLPPHTTLLPPRTAGAVALQTSWPGSRHSPGVTLEHLFFCRSWVLSPYLRGACHPTSQHKRFWCQLPTPADRPRFLHAAHSGWPRGWAGGTSLSAPPWPFQAAAPLLPPWPYPWLGQVGPPQNILKDRQVQSTRDAPSAKDKHLVGKQKDLSLKSGLYSLGAASFPPAGSQADHMLHGALQVWPTAKINICPMVKKNGQQRADPSRHRKNILACKSDKFFKKSFMHQAKII